MKETKLKSSCDDSHFMSGEIILTHKEGDQLGGIRMELDLQARQPVYIRKEEVKDLIDNLTVLYSKL